jgi:hypothetical protein
LGNLTKAFFQVKIIKNRTEKAKPETKIIFMRLIGSKLEKGETARVVAGPKKRSTDPMRLDTASLFMDKG